MAAPPEGLQQQQEQQQQQTQAQAFSQHGAMENGSGYIGQYVDRNDTNVSVNGVTNDSSGLPPNDPGPSQDGSCTL